jgi:hypothetical protein
MTYIYPRESMHTLSVIITIKSNYSSPNNQKERDFLFRKTFDLELNFVKKESVIFTELEDILNLANYY